MNTILADYLDERKETFLDDMQAEFDAMMKLIRRFKQITPDTQLLEIGSGTGWFQIRCKQQGIACRGLEINADMAACARELGERHGFALQIDVGGVETADIGIARYDIIIATSTFEHVKGWRQGLKKLAAALKDGGVLYFASTNRFSLTSGEYWIPLYGWLPDAWRYRLRRALQGDDIMEWGIDYNQFTYPQLRQFFRRIGFTRVLDRADVLDPEGLNNPTPAKQLALRLVKRFSTLKHVALCFSHDTLFICIK